MVMSLRGGISRDFIREVETGAVNINQPHAR